MLTRFEPTKPPVDMPESWLEEAKGLFSSVYGEQLKVKNSKFEIIARSYEKELVLAVSLIESENPHAIPVTYIASVDNDLEDSEKTKKLLDILVDSVGVFFDSYYSTENWNDYIANWQEATFKDNKVYYVVTRENLELMLVADELLKNSLH